jgi:hypothetical protein
VTEDCWFKKLKKLQDILAFFLAHLHCELNIKNKLFCCEELEMALGELPSKPVELTTIQKWEHRMIQ